MEEDIKELQSVDEEIENKTELLEMTQSDEETAVSIQGDIITIENNLRRVRQLNVLLEDLQATLGGAGRNNLLCCNQTLNAGSFCFMPGLHSWTHYTLNFVQFGHNFFHDIWKAKEFGFVLA